VQCYTTEPRGLTIATTPNRHPGSRRCSPSLPLDRASVHPGWQDQNREDRSKGIGGTERVGESDHGGTLSKRDHSCVMRGSPVNFRAIQWTDRPDFGHPLGMRLPMNPILGTRQLHQVSSVLIAVFIDIFALRVSLESPSTRAEFCSRSADDSQGGRFGLD
jgi:hypothetical protein